MATDGMASWIDLTDPKYAAADLRRLDSLMKMPGGPVSAPFSSKSGRRVNGAGLQVSIGGSPESWTCTPGPCEVYDPGYSTQGGWSVEIPNATTGTIGARPSTGQSRIDLIVVRVYDNGAIGSGPSEVKVERLPGNPGTSPVAPTPPAGSITFEVARLTVPATGSVTVTHSTERTVAAGGVLPVPTTAAMNKLKTDNVAYEGMVVNNAQTKSLHRYDGTNWKRQIDADSFIFGEAKWGVAYDPAVHEPVTYAHTFVGTTTPGGILTVIPDLSVMFAGISSAPLVPGDQVGGLRYVTAIPSGNSLQAYCYVAAGSGVVSQTVRVDVTVHGWR